MAVGNESRAGLGALREPGPEDRFATALMLAAAAAVTAYLAFTQKLFGDGDTGWHLAAGRYIAETGSIPAADPFSYTFRGHPWHTHEWLAEVAMAGAYGVGGWGGLALLFAIAGGLTIFLIGRELMRWIAVRWALCATVLVGALLHPLALARPHLLAWPLLAGWVLVLVRAREKGRAPNFAALAIMLAWANLHASYILGLGIAAVLTLEAFLDHHRDRPALLHWGAFLAGALLVACITPHGVQGFLYPFQVSGMGVIAVIDEWRPTNLQDHPLFIAFAIGTWALIAWRWRFLSGPRLMLLAGLTAMAFAHSRHQVPCAIVAALVAIPIVAHGEGFRRRTDAAGQRGVLLTAVAMAAVLIAVRIAMPFELKDNSVFPLNAMARVPATLQAQPVLNGYSFGGPLILNGVRPYIDGRSDMYGDEFSLDFLAMLRGDMARFRHADRRWGFAWTILPPRVALASRLDREPGWRRLYRDRWAVVHVKHSAKADAVTQAAPGS